MFLPLFLSVAIVCVVAFRALSHRWETHQLGDAVREAWNRLSPPGPLTWSRLERVVVNRATAQVTVSVSGRIVVPARFHVRLAEQDFDVVAGAVDLFQEGVAAALRLKASAKDWSTSGPIVVSVVEDLDITPGCPRVTSTIGRTPRDAPPATVPASSAATRTMRSTGGPSRLESRDGTIHVLPTDRHRLTIGRGVDCDLVIDVATVSVTHATLHRTSGSWYVEDRASTNGTHVDDRRLIPGTEGATCLREGARIQLGSTGPAWTFRSGDASCDGAVSDGVVPDSAAVPTEPYVAHGRTDRWTPEVQS